MEGWLCKTGGEGEGDFGWWMLWGSHRADVNQQIEVFYLKRQFYGFSSCGWKLPLDEWHYNFHKMLHHIRHVAGASLDMPSEHGVAGFEMLSWLSVASSRGELFSRGEVWKSRWQQPVWIEKFTQAAWWLRMALFVLAVKSLGFVGAWCEHRKSRQSLLGAFIHAYNPELRQVRF